MKQEIIISNCGIVRDARTKNIIGYTENAPTRARKFQFLKHMFKQWLKEAGSAASYAINR